jgi:hypothetical protein
MAKIPTCECYKKYDRRDYRDYEFDDTVWVGRFKYEYSYEGKSGCVKVAEGIYRHNGGLVENIHKSTEIVQPQNFCTECGAPYREGEEWEKL